MAQTSTADCPTLASARLDRCVGIWRLIERFHSGQYTDLYYAQPIEAAGTQRADYVVKLCSSSDRDTQEATQQLRQEAAACSQAQHPNLIALLDGQPHAPVPYLVFPRLDGKSLSAWLASKCTQPLPVNLWWMRQAAQALQALHQAGWVHGDIKPDNLMVSLRGHLTVIDLGLAIRWGTPANCKRFQGTPQYAAPELIAAQTPHQGASDIYALGLVFYELVARQPLANLAMPPQASILKQMSVPGPVIELILQMTSPCPDDRPQASSLVHAIFQLEIETLGNHIQPLEDSHLEDDQPQAA